MQPCASLPGQLETRSNGKCLLLIDQGRGERALRVGIFYRTRSVSLPLWRIGRPISKLCAIRRSALKITAGAGETAERRGTRPAFQFYLVND
jgi:hypothetical protein